MWDLGHLVRSQVVLGGDSQVDTFVGIAKVALGGDIRVDNLVGIQGLLLWGQQEWCNLAKGGLVDLAWH